MHKLDLSDANLLILRNLLKEHVPQAQVWAFGSRVNGDAHEGSDLDLVLRNPDDLSKESKGGWALKEALTESQITILVDVHDWAFLPESFHQNIERHYLEL